MPARVSGGGDPCSGALAAEDAGDVSSEAAVALYAAIACVVGGTIGVSGVLAGLLVGRRLRERPRVKCVATDWRLESRNNGAGREAVCSFELDLFNEGLLATGLRGVSAALRAEDGTVAVGRLKDPVSGEPLWAIDLPARRWAHASARVVFKGEEARALMGFRRADLLGRFPDGAAFELKIVERGDFVASPKRASSGREDYTAWRNLRSRLFERGRHAG